MSCAQHPAEAPEGQAVIAITDNLSTRTTKEVRDWLSDHPRRRFVFTPKHASWLNQVEIFFSILARRLLKHAAFTSEQDLARQMLAFVELYNQTAKPFQMDVHRQGARGMRLQINRSDH